MTHGDLPMTPLDVDDRSSQSIRTYRCVCGELVATNEDQASCGSCGRSYDGDFLKTAGADTISIDADLAPARVFAPSECDSNIGTRLGHFKILSRIGTGGMGAVYHALDESLQRYVALKVIQSASGGSESADLDRLFQEARAQARVNHPHVVHVYFVGMESKTPFLAMELVSAGTVADRVREGPIAFDKIVSYAIQVTRALGCAAQYDIVHGDIKPSNVLVVDEQTVKLSDFGLARQISTKAESTSKLSGTPDYMPPECTRGGRPDHRGDMYSLGVTLFQMTFGRLPYSTAEGGDLSDQLRMHREAAVEFPERWPADLPEGWKWLLQRLLCKDPSSRPESFADLEADLRKLTPIDLPVANPLLRGLAWAIDGVLLAAGLVVAQVLSTFFNALPNPLLLTNGLGSLELGTLGVMLNFALGAGFLTAIAMLQTHWGNTTGKRFLQILIVDQHGLKPRRRDLAIRTLFQFSWAWWFVISAPLSHFGLMSLSLMTGGFVLLTLLLEMASVLLRNGQSLHDTVLGTRVVLDASPEP